MALRTTHVAAAARDRQTRSAGQKTSVFDCGIRGAALLFFAGSVISMT
jgi:hypothetical protein